MARRTRSATALTAARTAGIAILLGWPGAALAQREDPGLRMACAGDYFRLCAGVNPGSREAETCMDSNRPRLSPECRAAIGHYNRRSGTRAAPSAR